MRRLLAALFGSKTKRTVRAVLCAEEFDGRSLEATLLDGETLSVIDSGKRPAVVITNRAGLIEARIRWDPGDPAATILQ